MKIAKGGMLSMINIVDGKAPVNLERSEKVEEGKKKLEYIEEWMLEGVRYTHRLAIKESL
jgi:hypothetical protein